MVVSALTVIWNVSVTQTPVAYNYVADLGRDRRAAFSVCERWPIKAWEKIIVMGTTPAGRKWKHSDEGPSICFT